MNAYSWVVVTALAVLAIMALVGFLRALSLSNQNADLRIQGNHERERNTELRKEAVRLRGLAEREKVQRINAEDSLAVVEDANRILVRANSVLLADAEERQARLQARREKRKENTS